MSAWLAAYLGSVVIAWRLSARWLWETVPGAKPASFDLAMSLLIGAGMAAVWPAVVLTRASRWGGRRVVNALKGRVTVVKVARLLLGESRDARRKRAQEGWRA